MKMLAVALLALLTPQTYVYPVKVWILDQHAEARLGLFAGAGHGNVFDDRLGVRGFDYVYRACAAPLDLSRDGRASHNGRWTAPQRLVVSETRIGESAAHECTLRITLRDFIYSQKKAGGLGTLPLGTKNATLPQ